MIINMGVDGILILNKCKKMISVNIQKLDVSLNILSHCLLVLQRGFSFGRALENFVNF